MNIWKKPLENGSFLTQIVNKIGQKNYCEIDWYVGKYFWAKKSAQYVIRDLLICFNVLVGTMWILIPHVQGVQIMYDKGDRESLT